MMHKYNQSTLACVFQSCSKNNAVLAPPTVLSTIRQGRNEQSELIITDSHAFDENSMKVLSSHYLGSHTLCGPYLSQIGRKRRFGTQRQSRHRDTF